ncbi:MAG TPA: SRPBCC family protein [Noviherbaspirillum sp.]
MKWESRSNQSFVTLLGVAAASALTMYLSDPDRGRRRRALAADKMRSLANKTSDAISVASRDLGNRAQGLRAQARNMFSRRGRTVVDDEVTVARVRKEIGRVVSHPRAVKVTSEQGCITLHGPILASEKQALLDCVRALPDITEVQDNLEVHETAEHVPSLQGEGKRRQYGSLGVQQGNWPPALRAIATVGGGALGYYGVVRRSPASMVAAMVGLGLIARGVTNRPLSDVSLAGKRRKAIDLHKTIHIAAPPDKVFDMWSKVENFPQFMSHVEEVRDLGNGRTHWVVRGPAGVPVEWNALTTESVRPRLLSWNSEPDSSVQQTGTVQLEPEGDGTRVSVHLSYSPPGGALGHAAASLFGDNPKQQMDQDLMRMKAFIETGHPPSDAARPAQAAPAVQPEGSILH